MQQRVEPSAPIIRQEPQTMRMPKIEDFPPVVQAEIDHRAAQQPVASHSEERGPMGLLKRLTSSLGRHEEPQVAQAAGTAGPAAAPPAVG